MNGKTYTREKPPGFLEKAGVSYYRRLAHKAPPSPTRVALGPLGVSDRELVIRTRLIAYTAALISVLVGVATSAVSVWFSVRYQNLLDDGAYYSALILITVVSMLVEFVVLFFLTIKMVHRISEVTHPELGQDDPLLPGDDAISNLLARAALELPDPVVRYLGIDPLKYISKPKMFMVGFLYKAKVFLTTTVVKLVLQRLGGKMASRIGLDWIGLGLNSSGWILERHGDVAGCPRSAAPSVRSSACHLYGE